MPSSFDEWFTEHIKRGMAGDVPFNEEDNAKAAYLAGLRAAAGMACLECAAGRHIMKIGDNYNHVGYMGDRTFCCASAIHREIASIEGEK